MFEKTSILTTVAQTRQFVAFVRNPGESPGQGLAFARKGDLRHRMTLLRLAILCGKTNLVYD